MSPENYSALYKMSSVKLVKNLLRYRAIDNLPEELLRRSFNTISEEKVGYAFIKQMYTNVSDDNSINYTAIFGFSNTIPNIETIVERSINECEWQPFLSDYIDLEEGEADYELVNEDNHHVNRFNFTNIAPHLVNFQTLGEPEEPYWGVFVWNNPDYPLRADIDYGPVFADAFSNIVEDICDPDNGNALSCRLLNEYSPMGKVYEITKTVTRQSQEIPNLRHTSLGKTNKFFQQMAENLTNLTI